MKKPLSFSAITTYTTCGKKYELRYKQGLRSKYFHAALAFGSAIDISLNELLKTKNLQKANEVFEKNWTFQFVNKKYESLSQNENLVYAESDFDKELLKEDDTIDLENFLIKNDLTFTSNPYLYYEDILTRKKEIGWDNLSNKERQFYNYANWLSLRQKGLIMLQSYVDKILPNIIEVLAVQKEQYLINSDGDKVIQYLDLIVKWKDGRNILLDNKTSSRDYDEDSASKSPQLISYYSSSKEEYKLDAVGFIVLKKQIVKNKVKICSQCSHNGTGQRHQKCDNIINSKRCNGEWKITIDPECFIQVIINDVHPNSEELVLSTFDEANEGIKKENFYKNLSACKNGPIICDYFKKCWYKDDSEIVKINE